MHLALARSDGGVSIMALLEGSDPAQEVAKWEGVSGGIKATRTEPVDASALPSRRFRLAWKMGAAGVEVDLAAARGVVLSDLRAERNRRLDDSERLMSRANEIGTPSDQKAVRDYRQALRDLPAKEAVRIEAMTVAELEAYAPAWPTPA
ncbi:MAG TPA: phage tail assembly chaperone [Tepidisphaeraceae bacterium]|nr:phage tail assembly chaperone [Tepidisphaeraceae bacterium]